MNSSAIDPAALSSQLTRAAGYTTSSAANGAGTATSSTISSKDFLTLLVTQLKNQDPTQPQDPSAYVQQLVGVNSLEQLIDINTQLTSLGGKTTTSTTGSSS